MLDFDWLLLECMGGSNIDEKTLRNTLSCRCKPIKPPTELQTAPQDEANAWEKFNIPVMLKLASQKSHTICTAF